MVELDNNTPVTAEQLGQELVRYVQSAEFGTPEYQALSDYFDRQSLYEDLIRNIGDVTRTTKDTKARLQEECGLHITEMRIAFLEESIRKNVSQLKGYETAYFHIDASLEDIALLASNEAEEMFPGNSGKQELHRKKIYKSFERQVIDIVSNNRD